MKPEKISSFRAANAKIAAVRRCKQTVQSFSEIQIPFLRHELNVSDSDKTTTVPGKRAAAAAAGESKTDSFYLPELDVLRFLAFVAIFITHAFSRGAEFYQEKLGMTPTAAHWTSSVMMSGTFSLDLFFALSAYLIAELLIREYEKTGRLDVWAFYARRALRIYPLYYVFILLALIILPRLFDDVLTFPHNFSFLFFAGNWTCAVYGLPRSSAVHLWSVSVEEQFYLTFPLLIVLFGVRKLPVLCALLIAVGIATRYWLVASGAPDYAIWCNTFVRLDAIAAGVLLAYLLRNGYLRRIESGARRVLLGSSGVALCVLAVGFKVPTNFLFPVVALAVVFILFSFMHPRGIDCKRYAPLIYLGRITYGLYVFHLLAMTLAETIPAYLGKTGAVYIAYKTIGGFFLTVILAMLSYKFLEMPFLKLKKKYAYIKTV